MRARDWGQRRTRALARLLFLVPLLTALLIGIPAAQADYSDAFTPAQQAEIRQISDGLKTFSDSMSGLNTALKLWQHVRYGELNADGSEDLRLASIFADSLKTRIDSNPISIHALEQSLNFTQTYSGVRVELDTAISPHAPSSPTGYDVEMKIDVSRSGTTPLKFKHQQIEFGGGQLSTGFHLATGDVTESSIDDRTPIKFHFDPTAPVGSRLYLDTSEGAPAIEAAVEGDADFDTTPFDVNVGFLRASVTGTAAGDARFRASLQDPDNSGTITETEWTNTAVADLVDVSCVSASANLDLDLSAKLVGDTGVAIGGVTQAATIDLDDTSACPTNDNPLSGLDTPNVQLQDLGDFKNITLEDFLNTLAQLSSSLDAMANTGPAAVAFPFLKQKLGDFVAFNQKLRKFLYDVGVCNDCLDPTKPIKVDIPETALDPTNPNNIATIQRVLSKLAETLFGSGTAANLNKLGLAYDEANRRITFDINVTKTPTTHPASLDLAAAFRDIGLNNISPGSTTSVTVTPQFALKLPVAIDVTTPADPENPPNLLDRIAILTGGTGPEITADAPVSANLDLEASIGFLGVSLKDSASGTTEVPILARRDVSRPMFAIDLADGPNNDGKLKVSELFDVLSAASGGIGSVIENQYGVFNATVPQFTLAAEAKLATGTVLANCDVKVAWEDVGVGKPDFTFPAAAGATEGHCFTDELMAFDFGLDDDPQKLFGNIMEALGKVVDELDKLADTEEGAALREELPLLGKSVKDVITEFRAMKTKVDEFVALPSTLLQQLQWDLRAAMAEAIGVTPLPETACTDAVDNDLDGFVNDGCVATGNPEIGDACKDNKDENTIAGTGNDVATDNREGDETSGGQPAPDAANDGCPARANGSSMLSIEIEPQDDNGTPELTTDDTGVQVIFRLGFGICGDRPGAEPGHCTVVKPLTVPLNLDTEALGGLVQTQGAGALNVYYEARADLNFGVELPRVRQALRAPDPDDSPEKAEIQTILSSSRQCLLTGGTEDSCAPDWNAINTKLDNWYDAKIAPLIASAQGDSANLGEIREAVTAAISFERQKQLLGLSHDDSAGVLSTTVPALMNAGKTRFIDPALNAAKADALSPEGAGVVNDVPAAAAAITQAIAFERQAQLLGMSEDGSSVLSDITVITDRVRPEDVHLIQKDTPGSPVSLPIDLPVVVGSPKLFLLDSTGLKLKVDFGARGVLTASLGQLQVGVGTTAVVAETICDETTAPGADSDSDGTINDGCPAAAPASGGTPVAEGGGTAEAPDAACADSLDNDGDGKFNDGCPAVADKAFAQLGASFRLRNDVGTAGAEDRVVISSAATAGTELVNFLTGMLPNDFSFAPKDEAGDPLKVTCPGDTTLYDGCASFPIYLGASTTPLCRISFTAPDLMDPEGWGFNGLYNESDPTDASTCAGALTGRALDWSVIVQGIAALSRTLQATLEGASYNVKIPVIGEALDGGAKIAKTFNDNVVTPLAGDPSTDPVTPGLVDALAAKLYYGPITTEIRSFLWTNVRANGNTLFVDWNNDGTTNAQDITFIGRCNDTLDPTREEEVDDPESDDPEDTITITVPNGDGAAGDTTCLSGPVSGQTGDDFDAGGHAIGHIKDFQIRASLGQTLGSVQFGKFDIGFPGLKLESHENFNLQVGWRLDLALGIDRDTGFYLATDKQAPGRTSELTVGADLSLPGATFNSDDEIQSPSFSGELAFLKVKLADNTSAGDLDFNLKAGLEGGNLRTLHDAPHKAATAAVDTTSGNLSGSYTYKVTYVDQYAGEAAGESALGPASGAAAPANQKVALTGIPIGPAGTTARKIYRSKDGGAFKLVTTLSNNTDTSYTDNTGDGSVGADAPAASTLKQTRLELADLMEMRDPTDPAGFSVGVEGGVHLDLQIDTVLSLPALSTDPGSLPSLRVQNFKLDWVFGAGAGNDEMSELSTDSTPAIALNGVQLGLGKWMTQFVQPIVAEIQKYTKPFQPVIDAVTTPLPVLSDLAEALGSEPVTVLYLLKTQQSLNGQPGSLDMIDRLIYLIKFINQVNVPLNGNANLYVPIGNFPILDDAARNGIAPDQTESIMGAPGSLTGDVFGQLNSVSSGMRDKIAEAQTSKGGFSFPAFQQPVQLVQFLLGKEVTLVQYDTGVLSKEVAWQYKYGPPIWVVPASVGITATFGVEGRFIIGYDTKGIREAFRIFTDRNADGTLNTSNDDVLAAAPVLFQGVYVSDMDITGKKDVAEIQFRASIVLFAQLDIVIAQAGVDGGVYGELGLNLHDGLGNPPAPGTVDGKLRIDEIVSRIKNPICLFDTEGSIYAKARLFATVSLPWGKETIWEHTLGKGEIYSLNGLTADCFREDPPELAKIVGDRLVLLMGSQARRDDRAFKKEATNEKFIVRQLNTAGTKFSVTAFGLTQEFPASGFHANPLSIFADGASGGDTVDLQPGGTHFKADGSAVQETVPFTRPAVVCGGPGDDTLAGGGANDTLVGDGVESTTTAYTCATTEAGADGADTILGGDGADTIHGSGGADVIKGDLGNDPTLNGGGGTDNISGGFGADGINGGGEADTLAGGPELDPNSTQAIAQCSDAAAANTPCVGASDVIDTIHGGLGNDQINGETGADQLYGGDDADTIRGTIGNDHIRGEGGNDRLFGAEGTDTLEGGAHDDELMGDAGPATLKGGSQTDGLGGGRDDTTPSVLGDTLEGGSGDDWMAGDEGLHVRNTDGTRKEVTLGGTFAGRDRLFGDEGADTMWGQAGADTMNGGGDGDTMVGSLANDTMNGEGVTASGAAAGGTAGVDTMFGDEGEDVMHGDGGNDVMRGGAERDQMDGDANNDEMYGDHGPDAMRGGTETDTMRGGIGTDTMNGNAGGDFMYGEADVDTMFGDDGNDKMAGDAADDDIEGNGGGDTLEGDAGQDDIVGGTGNGTAGEADGGDTIHGGDGVTLYSSNCDTASYTTGNLPYTADCDVIVGDNGTITRSNPATQQPDKSVTRSVSLNDPNAGGNDTIFGDEANDRIYGGGGTDTIWGDDQARTGDLSNATSQDGDDYVEGNGGTDTIRGGIGQDDLIGGTSQGSGDQGDLGDTMYGEAGPDVVLGDNASITRPVGTDGEWIELTFDESTAGVVKRTWTLHDVADTSAAQETISSGDDTMDGGDDYDRMYGQGGGDTMTGGNGQDYMEGNSNPDTRVDRLEGQEGADDLVGGTGPINGDSETQGTQGRLDSGDELFGGPGYDVMAGDNALLVRTLNGDGQWELNGYNDGVAHATRVLLDDEGASPHADTSGPDRMEGGPADDLMYGGGASDVMRGDSGDDVMEGNNNDAADSDANTEDGDVMHGNGPTALADGESDQDDMYGGTAEAGKLDGIDTMHGDDQYDVMLGDNGDITRPVATLDDPDGTEGDWYLDTFRTDVTKVVRRITTLHDVADQTAAPDAGLSGGDVMNGNADFDVMYGQGGNDLVHGNDGDDRIQGNANGTGNAPTTEFDGDVLYGDAGQDDVIGGTGRTTSNDAATAVPGRLDGADTIYGGDGAAGVTETDYDVLSGDNATVDRPRHETAADGIVAGEWMLNSFNSPAVERSIRLIDVALDSADAPASTSGGDKLYGEASDDVVFGQGGNDTGRGGGGDDYVEGNAADDTLYGDGGQDDLTGGGSAKDGVIANRDGAMAARERITTLNVGNTLRDGNDTIYGDDNDAATPDDADVIAGDNASLTRPVDTAGLWKKDTQNTQDDVIRDVQLFDVDHIGVTTIAATTSGADVVIGEGGRDLLFGGGAGDDVSGGGAFDYIEGNHGGDTLEGNADEDDMLGGSSAQNGDVFQGPLALDLADGGDTMRGNVDDDVMLGDNGTITRAKGASGAWLKFVGGRESFDIVERTTTMAQRAEAAGAFGDDTMSGGDGHDDMYGELGHDYLRGQGHDDAIVGDLGLITNNLLGDARNDDPAALDQTIRPNEPFIADSAYVSGTLYRLTKLYAQGPSGHGGNDTILGGTGRDSVHAGNGHDTANGDEHDDRVFGGDGDDVLWGGANHDHQYGGHGRDYIDVRPSQVVGGGSRGDKPTVPATWATYGKDDFLGIDYIYGGWDQDAMQANQSEPGPSPNGDRLLDWVGVYNAYYRCDAAFGEYVITRDTSPSLQAYLDQQAAADGAFGPTSNSVNSGFRELGMVRRGDYAANNAPRHPDTPGHFTCSTGATGGTAGEEGKPDVTLESADIALSKAKIVEGDTVTVTATIKNVGDAAADDVNVRFSDGVAQIGAIQKISRIAVGGSAQISVAWKPTAAGGVNYDEMIVVNADYGTAIAEKSEENNVAARVVTVYANRVANGSFEASSGGGSPDGWTGTGAVAYTSNADGTKAVSATGADASWLSNAIAVAGGTSYTLALRASSSNASVYVQEYDSAGALVSTTKAPLGGTFAVGGATASIRLKLVGAAGSTATTFDDVRLTD